MAVSQAEYVAFKAELSASAALVTASIAKLEEVATKSNADTVAAQVVILELQIVTAPYRCKPLRGLQQSKQR